MTAITEKQYNEAKLIVEQYELQLKIAANNNVDHGLGFCKEKNCKNYCKHREVSKYIEPCYSCRNDDGYNNWTGAITI